MVLQHGADAGIEVVARIFQTVLDVAHAGHDVECGSGRRGHEHDEAHALEVIRADADGEGVFLARQTHEHDELVGAERLDLCARRVDGERLCSCRCRSRRPASCCSCSSRSRRCSARRNVHLNGAARAGALVCFDRNAVELVGNIEVPRHLDVDRVVRDALVVEAVLIGVQLPVDRVLLEGRLVKGGHIVNVLVVSEIREFGVAVEVYALDDARVGRRTVVIHVDVYGFVGLDCRSGGLGALRQRERKQECGRGNAAQLISFIVVFLRVALIIVVLSCGNQVAQTRLAAVEPCLQPHADALRQRALRGLGRFDALAVIRLLGQGEAPCRGADCSTWRASACGVHDGFRGSADAGADAAHAAR